MRRFGRHALSDEMRNLQMPAAMGARDDGSRLVREEHAGTGSALHFDGHGETVRWETSPALRGLSPDSASIGVEAMSK
jgi:hypothetical protein